MALFQLIISDGDDPMRKQQAPRLVHVKRLGRLRSLWYRLRGWGLAHGARRSRPPLEAPNIPQHLDKFDLAIAVPEDLSEKLIYDLVGIYDKSSVQVVVCLPERRRRRRAVEV